MQTFTEDTKLTKDVLLNIDTHPFSVILCEKMGLSKYSLNELVIDGNIPMIFNLSGLVGRKIVECSGYIFRCNEQIITDIDDPKIRELKRTSRWAEQFITDSIITHKCNDFGKDDYSYGWLSDKLKRIDHHDNNGRSTGTTQFIYDSKLNLVCYANYGQFGTTIVEFKYRDGKCVHIEWNCGAHIEIYDNLKSEEGISMVDSDGHERFNIKLK